MRKGDVGDDGPLFCSFFLPANTIYCGFTIDFNTVFWYYLIDYGVLSAYGGIRFEKFIAVRRKI